MPVEEIHFSKQLLVEGRTAVPFARALLRKLGHENAVQVQNFGSRDDYGPFLSAFVKMPGFARVQTLGVMIDAEEDPAGTCQKVTHHAQRAGLNVPTPAREFSTGSPKFGYFVMPDESTAGMLETLCLRSVDEDPALHCADEYFRCLDSRKITPPKNTHKARAQAYLASRERAGLLVGEAAHAGYWNWEHDSMKSLRQFFSDLANV